MMLCSVEDECKSYDINDVGLEEKKKIFSKFANMSCQFLLAYKLPTILRCIFTEFTLQHVSEEYEKQTGSIKKE